MSRFKEGIPSQQGWIHEIARAELHPDAEKLLQLDRVLDPQQLVEEETVEFMTELRESFSEIAHVFNSYSENGTKYPEIKIYSIAQTPSDFMLFRNQIKLLISNPAHGVIQISFAQHQRNTFSVNGQVQQNASDDRSSPGLGQSQDLLVQIGPFRDIYFTFQGERVTPEQISKFYFGEFVKVTRDPKRSKGSNQLLLDQIKALLHEKGLEL